MVEQPQTLDLFCGCGGLSLGFKNAGFNVRVANDKWNVALDTYAANFPEAATILGDITSEKIQERIIKACGGKIDVIVGGPPCQAYSLAGSRDPEDPRGQLVKSYIKMVDMLKPKAFVVENVKKMKTK